MSGIWADSYNIRTGGALG